MNKEIKSYKPLNLLDRRHYCGAVFNPKDQLRFPWIIYEMNYKKVLSQEIKISKSHKPFKTHFETYGLNDRWIDEQMDRWIDRY